MREDVVERWRRGLGRAVAAAVLATAGCGPDLGECDMTMLGGSTDETSPAPNAGQEVINTNCANGRCHSATAKGDLRVGAPAELNFDVVPRTTDATEISKTRDGTEVVADHREDMWAAIDDGDMPPAKPAGSGPLSAEDKETVRNWLACGAPVIAAPSTVAPVGAEWRPIYEALVGTVGCKICHGETSSASGQGFKLGDPGDACNAYRRVVDAKAVTMACGPSGQTLVVAGRPEMSLLLSKLEGTQTCGVPMPYLQPALGASNPVVMDLRAWIMAGAPKPADCP